MKDFYKILDINPSTTEKEIKTSFHKLAYKYYPDKNQGNDKKFKEINEAYQVLSDKYQRGVYDATIFIKRQQAKPQTTTQKNTIKNPNVIQNTAILFLIGIGFWIWGDRSNYNGFLVFLGWVSMVGAFIFYRKNKNTY